MNIPTFVPPTASVNLSSREIAHVIQNEATSGVIRLTNLCPMPTLGLEKLFDLIHANPDFSKRFNEAYKNNLVFKDSFSIGKGGPTVDMKRVLDLSPERFRDIMLADPTLFDDLHKSSSDNFVHEVIDFWMNCTDFAPKIIDALSMATGCDDLSTDSHYNYRAVDYYERPVGEKSPRCGEHRDFGLCSLIFASCGGLEVFVNDQWQRVAADMSPTSAVLLFGWCTQIRSNGRIPAVLHRVVDDELTASGLIPRRISAVLFVAPKEASTPLEPVVVAGERQRYVSGIKVGHLRGSMARKWKKREGTLSEEQEVLEEADILLHGATQDELVKKTIEVKV